MDISYLMINGFAIVLSRNYQYLILKPDKDDKKSKKVNYYACLRQQNASYQMSYGGNGKCNYPPKFDCNVCLRSFILCQYHVIQHVEIKIFRS